MVEKWLLQVENLMLKSVRHVIHQGVIQYAEVFYIIYDYNISIYQYYNTVHYKY